MVVHRVVVSGRPTRPLLKHDFPSDNLIAISPLPNNLYIIASELCTYCMSIIMSMCACVRACACVGVCGCPRVRVPVRSRAI